MTNNNNLIPKENYKKVEEVREIENKELITPEQQANLTVKNEYPTFEEFMKTYEGEEGVIDNYEFEVDSYGDIRIKGTYYGPGFWDDIKGFVKPVATGALVVASVFPPTAAVAAPVAYTVLGTGVAAHTVGEITDSDFLKEIGRDLAEIGSGARDGQGAAESPQGVKQGSLNEYARSRK